MTEKLTSCVIGRALAEQESVLAAIAAHPESATPLMQAIAQKRRIRIARPCSLQGRDQALEIKQAVSPYTQADRFNYHKPRTRLFDENGQALSEGIGLDTALPIYQELHEDGTGVATEILEETHVARLRGLVDLVWTGARSGLVYLIRKIAIEATEAGIPIMVKNPMLDDPTSYLGMLEAAACATQGKVPVIACIRGTCPITAADKAQWRNVPNLQYIEMLKASFPDLTIVVDPSHMVNKKDPNAAQTVKNILLEAMSMGADGHMVEVTHPSYPSVTDPGILVDEYQRMIDDNQSL